VPAPLLARCRGPFDQVLVAKAYWKRQREKQWQAQVAAPPASPAQPPPPPPQPGRVQAAAAAVQGHQAYPQQAQPVRGAPFIIMIRTKTVTEIPLRFCSFRRRRRSGATKKPTR
jgi:hypothetical protein